MKFMFEGHLFRFFQDSISVVTPYGDKYKIILNRDKINPFIITLIRRYNHKEDMEQLEFEKELKSDLL